MQYHRNNDTMQFANWKIKLVSLHVLRSFEGVLDSSPNFQRKIRTRLVVFFPWRIIQSICNFALTTMTINEHRRTKVTDADVYAARQRFYNNNTSICFNAGETDA